MKRFLLAAALLAVVAPSLRAADDVQIHPDLIYGRKDGMALTLDVFKPKSPNGAAVLWLQSGGWYSNWTPPAALIPASTPLLSKGFTVIIVRHGSAPKYAIPDAVEDVRRAVRFVHLKAKDLGIDPDRIGVQGGSAGGHLSLMLGTTGDDGNPEAKDEVLKQSSRVAAVVALYPPTDLREWVTNPPEVIRNIPALKPPLSFDPAKGPDYSPVLHVTTKAAPILMIHGDKDELVPLEHSQKMKEAIDKGNAVGDVLVIEGAAHGFNAKHNETVVPALVGWFEKHLAAKGETK